MINQVLNALGELDYEDFKKPVEEFLQEHKTEQERKKQKTKDERPVDASAEDDIESNPAAAIEEEREDEDIDEDAEEEPEEEEGEANAAMAGEEWVILATKSDVCTYAELKMEQVRRLQSPLIYFSDI